METVSGVLHLTKKEVRGIEKLLNHVKQDIGYGWGGTFGGMVDKKGNEITDDKSMLEVLDAVRDIEWIIGASVIK